MSEHIYTSYEELKKNPPVAEVYITGSDQVWNDSCHKISTAGWFLQFGSEETKRISYAASIGRDLEESEFSFFSKYLSSFDAISVREESSRKLCENLGIRAQVCIDPTMLLPSEIYIKMARFPKEEKNYAFIYVLNIRSSEEFYWPAIKEYLETKGLAIKSVTGSGYYQGRELIDNIKNLLATIPEWLGYIKCAECVLTTSFHGTVFAILMHRPFLTIGLRGRHGEANTRIEQLLSTLGIPERMLTPNVDIRQQMEAPIDWEEVELRLNSMREDSLNFLRNNLIAAE